jgi:hypothetical protein
MPLELITGEGYFKVLGLITSFVKGLILTSAGLIKVTVGRKGFE